jgi:hypothetical protein
MTRPTSRRAKGGFRKAPEAGESEVKTPFRLELDRRWREVCLGEGADDRPAGAGDRST